MSGGGPAATGSVCGVCCTRCRLPFRAPTAELAPDLDGRPGEPTRSTLSRWVALCPGCGAAAPDLTALPRAAEAIVRRASVQAEPDRFLRWAAIAADPEAGPAFDPQAAAEAVLQAAWHGEDKGEDTSALRRRAAASWRGDPLRRLDILRRAGALTEAAAAVAELEGAPLDEDERRIVTFQRERIAAGDTGRHLLSSALRPPARTPHASHGQKAREQKSGWLGRLLGR